MFLLFGTRATATIAFVVSFVCGHCGVLASQQIVREENKFTLFFIPLFSVGTSWFVECSNCGIATPLTREQADHSLQWANSHGHAVA